jgi:single-strand DNA-binding protein
MASFNRVILMGNLTRDVEVRYTPGGTAVAEIGLAVNDRRKDAKGEWVDETTFVDVTLWGRTAEIASEYATKGSPLFIEGRLKLDQWEKDGQKRSKLSVVCENMRMLGGKGGGEERTPSPSKSEPAERTPPRSGGSSRGRRPAESGVRTGSGADVADDIPFAPCK